ncbi:MAG: DEAD/DEAH box helicase [Campylobacterota bacterium]|nr:DEAD/DEAH box helicase [Campylobacterota bacterium]
MSFHTLGLSKPIIDAVSAIGYETPTPVQEKVIPSILKGIDIFATAKTGSGKSAAFLLPLFQHINRERDEEQFLHVKVLILVPTRELARQIYASAQKYGAKLDVKTQLILGGGNINPQIEALKLGCEIIVATPGRLNDLIKVKAVNLNRVEHLVLDEADTMLDMGFLSELDSIFALLNPKRQNLLFSATHSGKVKFFAEKLLTNPKRIDMDLPGSAAEMIAQVAYLTDREKKMQLLCYLIGSKNYSQVLIFTSTRAEVDAIQKELKLAGLKADVIHGERTHGARHKALERFREAKVRILVATDIAARGLDIPDLPCVINFDMPQSKEDYIHRIGRTGRAGKSGEAVSLLSVDEDDMFRSIERMMKVKIPKEDFEGYERELVHVKMDKRYQQEQKKQKTKGAFGKSRSKAAAKSKKTTKRDFRYGGEESSKGSKR